MDTPCIYKVLLVLLLGGQRMTPPFLESNALFVIALDNRGFCYLAGGGGPAEE